MIRLLLYRVLPLAAAIGIFSSALSPVRPALDAFARAADALAGKTDAGGADFGAPDLKGALSDLQPSQKRSGTGKTLQELAADLRGEAAAGDDPYGHEAGARAPRPIQPQEGAPPPSRRRGN